MLAVPSQIDLLSDTAARTGSTPVTPSSSLTALRAIGGGLKEDIRRRTRKAYILHTLLLRDRYMLGGMAPKKSIQQSNMLTSYFSRDQSARAPLAPVDPNTGASRALVTKPSDGEEPPAKKARIESNQSINNNINMPSSVTPPAKSIQVESNSNIISRAEIDTSIQVDFKKSSNKKSSNKPATSSSSRPADLES